ncbi:hypothetical protein DLJ53_13790 [Acuticoccus sediminis]|uniref:TRAP transporter small permease protein n=1 Tax=Acuticoccus sediminis TaxID=2184697 RepID=A0A8B2NYI7_9HYPH|nr:TRAP transporter small permease [Acuticoccus sediminis]RAI02422.1 hypothetical protein DLJ53_13790 [Acuticoccus sediminis]
MTSPAKRFERAALALSSILLAVLFALLLTDVVLRALRIEFFWGSEGGGVLMAWIIVLALPMVTRTRSHIATDFIAALLPPRGGIALRIAGHVLMLAYLGTLVWLCADLAERNFLGGVRSQGILRLPVAYVQFGIVAGLVLVMVSQVLLLVEDARALVTRGAPS